MRNKKSSAWQYVLPGWFEECDHGVSECQSLLGSDTVKSIKLKMYDENSNFACFDAIYTKLVVTWPHCVTVQDFLAVSTDPDCRHGSDFSQRDGSDSTCGRIVHAVQNKTPELLFTEGKVWYKNENAFRMCSERHYTTRGLAYGDMTNLPTGSFSCLYPPISLVVKCHPAHAFSQ